MSDISNADFTVEGETSVLGEGLEDSSTLTAEMDAPDGFVSESDINPLFEVDGTPITLDEAKNGYLRQADYTKKTQELAEMRSRLAEAEAISAALQRDPYGTIEALKDAFGIPDAPTTRKKSSADDDFLFLDDEDVPARAEDDRIAALEAKIAAQERAANQAALEAELYGLHDQFGDFDDSELFAHAIRGNFPNLKAAYADLHFDTLRTEYEQLTAKQREEQERLAAKRQASVVQNKASRAGATAPTQTQFGSIREAYLAAKKSLGR